MGALAGVFAMSHVLGTPEGVGDQAERVFQGMREIGRQLRACRPDVLVVVSSDHMNNFSLESPMPLAVGVGEHFVPYGDMGIPTDPVPGHAAFARAFADFAGAGGLQLPQLSELRPDHGVMIPLAIVDPQRRIPMVPLYVNTVYDPAPAPAQCHALGGMLRRFVLEQRPEQERVAILACGGLSHWLGVPEEGRVNEDWDRRFLHAFTNGREDWLAGLDNADILAVAGNGGLEVNAWIVAAGAAAGARGTAVFYEPVPEWASGMAGAALDPDATA